MFLESVLIREISSVVLHVISQYLHSLCSEQELYLGRGCWWGRLHFFSSENPFLRFYMHTTYKVTHGTCNKYYYISNDCFNGNSLYGQYKYSGSVLGYSVSRSLIEGTSRKSKQAKRKITRARLAPRVFCITFCCLYCMPALLPWRLEQASSCCYN